MADFTWATATERVIGKDAPGLLVCDDGEGFHRVYFDAAGDPMQLARCCAAVLAMIRENGDLATHALRIAQENEGTQSFRVPKERPRMHIDEEPKRG